MGVGPLGLPEDHPAVTGGRHRPDPASLRPEGLTPSMAELASVRPRTPNEAAAFRRTPEYRERRARYIAAIRLRIEAAGFMIQGVMPSVDQPEVTPFAYTIGLTGQGLPELAVSGMTAADMGLFLNAAACRAPKDGYLVGSEHTVAELDVAFRVIEATTMAHGILDDVYPDSPVRVLQLVVCDENGLWPGDDGVDPDQEVFGEAWW